MVGERVEPFASGLVVDATCPGAWGGVDFALVAVDAIIFGPELRPEHDACIEGIGQEDFGFKDEIVVLFAGTEEGVGAIGDGCADDAVLLDMKRGFAAVAFPSFETLAIEKGLPALLRVDRQDAADAERKKQSKACEWPGCIRKMQGSFDGSHCAKLALVKEMEERLFAQGAGSELMGLARPLARYDAATHCAYCA